MVRLPLKTKWRFGAALIAAACLIVVIATITGMAAAIISTPGVIVQPETERPQANDGHNITFTNIIEPTGKTTHELPLEAAPTLDEATLFRTETVRVTVVDPEFGKKVTTMLHTTRVTRINDTVVIFHAGDGAEVRVWNGETKARLSADGPFMTVCSAQVTCAAFQVDTSTMEKLLADTENNLKNYSAARRRLAEACRLDQPIYDPLTGEEHTRMQTVAKDKCAAVCENTCPMASDAVCADGGNNSINEGGRFYCSYGTDCADCGPRPSENLDCQILSNQATLSKMISGLSSSSCDQPPTSPPAPPHLPPPIAGYVPGSPIAGYVPGSDVTQHNRIDLDQKEIEAALKASPADFTLAKTWYTVGGNSKTAAPYRTLQGFSTSAQAKMYEGCPGCPYTTYAAFYEYYGSHTYADDWVSAALDAKDHTFPSGKHGPNTFSTLGDAARIEAVKKGTAYLNVWMYTVREFEDAIDDCTSCATNCNEHSINSDSVHAWDEGVAFYTGSLEGPTYGGDRDGKMLA